MPWNGQFNTAGLEGLLNHLPTSTFLKYIIEKKNLGMNSMSNLSKSNIERGCHKNEPDYKIMT